MKKFLAVFDGYRMSTSTLQYAITLTQAAEAHLVGVFLDEMIYRNYSLYKVMTTNKDYEKVMKEMDAGDKRKRDDSVKKFTVACEKAGINFSIHRDKNIAIQELKHESMFADLILINEYETFIKTKEDPPTQFIKDLLGDVQCPVLVTPKTYKEVDKIVLLYDGKPYSLHAIKMFSYLFRNLRELEVEVYTVKDQVMTDLHLPENKLMKEFIKRHFPKADYTIVKGEPEIQIIEHIRSFNRNVLVVAGAYQRTDLSRWFKTSMADLLMKQTDVPIFIAHK